MCDPVSLTIAATAVTAAGQVASGIQQSQMAAYQAKVAEQSRRMAVDARRDRIDQGVRDQVIEDRKAAQLQGQQRASLAGAGVDISFGTAGDLQSDASLIASENRSQIVRNTAADAKTYSINAANSASQAEASRAQGSSALFNGFMSAGGTILGGAKQVSVLKKQGY